jgi:hypothetical protein
MAVMAWISASWWYILSTLLAVSGGEVLGGLVATALVWPPLMTGEGGHFVGSSLGRGEVHHQDPLHLERGLMSW